MVWFQVWLSDVIDCKDSDRRMVWNRNVLFETGVVATNSCGTDLEKLMIDMPVPPIASRP